MPDPEPANKAFEAALSKSLRTQRSADDGCPEPEVLAAYWERSLASGERARCESHLADCLRCQAQLVALARTATAADDPSGHTSVNLGWLLDWRWFAPAATVAVVLLAVWVIEPGAPAERGPAVADTEVASRSREGLAELETEPLDTGQRRDAAAPPPERSAEAALVPTAETTVLPSEEAVVARAPAQTERRENASVEPEARAADEVRRLEQQSLDARVAPTAPVDPQRPAQRELDDASTERRLVTESFAAREAAAVSTIATLADADTGIIIATPDTASLWRLTPSGGIERSTDGGATWAAQLTGANVEFTAGAAPSASTCWMVGRAGAVFRTLDGETWEPISPPTAADLASVEASDGMRATVTATDGTQYRTADGGETWSTL